MNKKISIRQFPSPEHPYKLLHFHKKNLAVLDIFRLTIGDIGPQSRLEASNVCDEKISKCKQMEHLKGI